MFVFYTVEVSLSICEMMKILLTQEDMMCTAGRQERLRMSIDEKEAPEGYVAVAPERWIRDGITGCVSCAYAGQAFMGYKSTAQALHHHI